MTVFRDEAEARVWRRLLLEAGPQAPQIVAELEADALAWGPEGVPASVVERERRVFATAALMAREAMRS